ncbi:MAG: PAS domain S-box protein [Alphaproteobacteria bacterium]|nr:PAS domain S-box protein [Alphaproteobacteria bacterium]
MSRFSDFRTRLAGVLFGTAMVPLLISAVLFSVYFYQRAYYEERTRLAGVAQYVASEVRAYFRLAEQRMVAHGDMHSIGGLPPRQQQELLSHLAFGHDGFRAVTFFDVHGAAVSSVSRDAIGTPTHQAGILERQIRSAAASPGPWISEVFYDRQTAEPIASLTVGFTDPQTGGPQGYMVADVWLRPIWDILATLDRDEGDSAMVLDARGFVIAHNDPTVVLRQTRYGQPGANSSMAITAGTPLAFGGQDFRIVVERSHAHFLKSVSEFFWVYVLVLIIAVPFVMVMTRELRRFISVPLREVTEAAQRMGGGDFSSRIQYAGRDEIGGMATAFNAMSAQLEETLHRLQAEKDLRGSLIDTLPDYITIMDEKFRYTDCNVAFAARVGRGKADLAGKTVQDLFSEEIALVLSMYNVRTLEGRRPARYEYRLEWPDGVVQYLDTIKVPLIASDGRPTGLIDIARDITEQKKVLESLRDREHEFRMVVAKSPLPIVLSRADGEIELLNPKFVELFGWSQDDVSNSHDWWPLAFPDRQYREFVRKEWERDTARAVREKRESSVHLWLLTCKDGRERYVELRMVPLTANRHLTVLNDVTERYLAEEELKSHRDHLEELVRRRTREVEEKAEELARALEKEKEYNVLQQKFVSLVSHEFRTPLAIIDGAAQRLVRREALLNAAGKIVIVDEVLDQRGNVVETRAQRRDGDDDGAEAVIEILAELALRGHGLEVAVGRRDDAHIGSQILGPAQPPELPRFQNAQQLGLDGR